MSTLVEFINVNKIYKTVTSDYHVLKDINFKLQQKDMLAIVGVSGSGKSTLMNIMGFLDQATFGQYLFNGVDVSGLNAQELARIRNKKIGFVFQSFFLLPRLSALQNVMLPLFYNGMDRKLATEVALQMLEKVRVAHLSQQKPNQLSGGQQQRVAIARALVNNPDLILADEPTGALDSQTGDEIMQLFSELNCLDNRTIVIITHDKEISKRCGKIVAIKDGRINLV